MSSAFQANAEGLSATEILAIPLSEPERLFPNDALGIKSLKKKLSMKWHPDLNKSDNNAGDVFDWVMKLTDSAENKIAKGMWSVPGQLSVESNDGRRFNIRYMKRHDFELGEFYISEKKVTYVLRPQFKDLYNNGLKTLKDLQYANDKMRDGIEKHYIPKIFKTLEGKNGDCIVVFERNPDSVLLRDCFNHCSGAIDPKHVAWITSRLHNFTSYLQWAGLTHNDLTLDTCFIIPKDRVTPRDKAHRISLYDHSLTVMGGWWYAAKNDAPLLGLANAAVNYAPRSVLTNGRASPDLDRTMIRVAARELLGDATGVRLPLNKDIPRPMVDWLAMPGSGDAIKDFQTWRDKILIDSFGQHRFVEMNISPDDIYKPIIS